MLALMQNPEFLFHYWLAILTLLAVVVWGWTWLLTTRNRPARAVTLHDIMVDGKACLVAIIALALGYRVKWTNGYVYCYARAQVTR